MILAADACGGSRWWGSACAQSLRSRSSRSPSAAGPTDQRHLPLGDLEPDDPGPSARAARGDRADQLVERPDRSGTSRPVSSRRSRACARRSSQAGSSASSASPSPRVPLPAFRRYDSREHPSRPGLSRSASWPSSGWRSSRPAGGSPRDPVLRRAPSAGRALRWNGRELLGGGRGRAERPGERGVGLDRVALGDRLVRDAREMPGLVREHMDRKRDVERRRCRSASSRVRQARSREARRRPARRTSRRSRA